MERTAAAEGVIHTALASNPAIRWRHAATSVTFKAEIPDAKHQDQQLQSKESPNRSRRKALFLFSLPAFVPCFTNPSSSTAFSLGIPGPKEWLKDQKKKASKFVLAPIEASRQSLRTAHHLMTSESPEGASEEVRRLLNSAARDCVPETRGSLVVFQASTGVEVCTFRLIVKNAASLLDKGDPVKLEAETRLDDLIRSFSFLGTVMGSCDFQLTTDREKVKDGLMDTISALDKFEEGIKDCLGV